MNESAVVMGNPVNKTEFTKWLFAAFIAAILVFIYALFRISHWSLATVLLAVVSVSIGFIFPFYLGWDGEYLRRPFKVEIRDDGILCHLRYNRKAKLIPWGEVISIGVHPVAPGKQPNRYEVDGPMWFKDERKRKKKEQYILHRSIAIAAREKYYEMMGRYPPMFYWERTDTVQYA